MDKLKIWKLNEINVTDKLDEYRRINIIEYEVEFEWNADTILSSVYNLTNRCLSLKN